MQQTIHIQGMTCGKCVSRVEGSLKDAGFEAEVSLEKNLAHVDGDGSLEDAIDAIEMAGFDASLEPFDQDEEAKVEAEESAETAETPAAPLSNVDERFDIQGMTCASCVAKVQSAIEKTPGVAQVSVNYASEVASVVYESGGNPQSVIDAVEAVGYEAKVQDDSDSTRISARRDEEAKHWKTRWIVGLALTLPILLLQMGPMWFGWSFTSRYPDFALAALTLLVWGYVGKPFHIGALRGLRYFSANMDTLVSLGATVALGYSMIVVVGDLKLHVYFDGAAMILTLISIGKWLESRSKASASRTMEALLDLAPQQAHLRKDGEWTRVDAATLEPGDIVQVRNGESVPADGAVTTGEGHLNESMLTGEADTVVRHIGDEVRAGTTNIGKSFELTVTHAGRQTVLAQIAQRVAQAQEGKADAQRLADKVSGVFVPIVILVAAVTFVGWYFTTSDITAAVLPAVAVLVVACPCALGLATPTAIMVGMSEAARRGVLIRDASTLEQTSRITDVVFDKTGTITHGRSVVSKVDSEEPKRALAIAAALEAEQSHPLAAAIRDAADADDLELPNVTDVETVVGKGVKGQLDGTVVRLGSLDWLGQSTDSVSSETVVGLEVDEQYLGSFIIQHSSSARPGADELFRVLQARGAQTWIMSGDRQEAVEATAEAVGVSLERAIGGLLPEDKADRVADLQRDGHVVAMIGDGINDAPVLASADIGIAMGQGTDLAKQSAAIILLSDSLDGVVRAIEASEAIHSKIRQNLIWAFLYNTLLIPVAAAGLLQPALAAGAMALSSVSVVTNSLLLKRRISPSSS